MVRTQMATWDYSKKTSNQNPKSASAKEVIPDHGPNHKTWNKLNNNKKTKIKKN